MFCIAGSAIIPRDAKTTGEIDGCFLHPYANPLERRTADQTWSVLCLDVNSGCSMLLVHLHFTSSTHFACSSVNLRHARGVENTWAPTFQGAATSLR